MQHIWFFSISFCEISLPQGYATNVTRVSLMCPVSTPNFCSNQDNCRWDLAPERPLDQGEITLILSCLPIPVPVHHTSNP